MRDLAIIVLFIVAAALCVLCDMAGDWVIRKGFDE